MPSSTERLQSAFWCVVLGIVLFNARELKASAFLRWAPDMIKIADGRRQAISPPPPAFLPSVTSL